MCASACVWEVHRFGLYAARLFLPHILHTFAVTHIYRKRQQLLGNCTTFAEWNEFAVIEQNLSTITHPQIDLLRLVMHTEMREQSDTNAFRFSVNKFNQITHFTACPTICFVHMHSTYKLIGKWSIPAGMRKCVVRGSVSMQILDVIVITTPVCMMLIMSPIE